MLIFHLKYVQLCAGYKLFQNVNISFEICANVSGGVWRRRMDPYKDPTWIPIWILYGSYMESQMDPYRDPYMDPYMDITLIPIWIAV